MGHWVPVKGYPNYEVSTEGDIVNIKTGRLLRQSDNRSGSMVVTLSHEGRSRTIPVRKIVAEAFMNNDRPGYLLLTHKNSDHRDCSLDNLIFASKSDVQWRRQRKLMGRDPDARKVRINETGEVFDNIFLCAQSIDGEVKQIQLSMYHTDYAYKGFTFSYV